jgi:hypothetical protein
MTDIRLGEIAGWVMFFCILVAAMYAGLFVGDYILSLRK